ncbi:MAG: hypothetical protein EAZ87_06255 [Nostocales cyanobacterium]|nr:MAG: hypothetical protein EAZ87_06255 [Nostocales cyanobacterium]
MNTSEYPYHLQQNPNNVKKRIAKPTWSGTLSILISLVTAYTTISTDMSPSYMCSQVAVIVIMGIIISIFCDIQRGWKNLFRVDLICISALYFLTLVEFLFPQTGFDERLISAQAIKAIEVLLIGFGGLVIGRHFSFFKAAPPQWLNFGNIPDKTLFRILFISAFLAYFYILLSVDFNPVKLIMALLGPRFDVPWGRGRLGDWRVFLSELSLFSYVIPPLTGIIWNRRQFFPKWQILFAAIIFIFTLFYGFSGGTRNVMAAYLATFMGGYFLTLRKPNIVNIAIPIAIITYSMVFATRHMLGFREMGIINYLGTAAYATEKVQGTLAVDYNLYSLALLVEGFPSKHDFLGLELLIVFLTKPIPRVLWPGKPEGLSISIEEVVGADGWTVSATYVGEAYMMGGIIAVILVSLFLGFLANWWSRTAAFHTTGYGIVVNALGFFTAAISMRSLVVFTTSMLPIFGLAFIAKTFPSLLGAKSSQSQYMRR